MKSSAPSCNLQKLILENVSDIIITTNSNFIVESWNHVAEHVYGTPASEAIGRRFGELVSFKFHGTTIEQAFQDLAIHKIWRGEVSYTNKHGETFYFLQTVKYAVDEEGNESGILAVGRDITDRKRAEQQLEQSEKFYRSLISDALDVTMLMNGDGDISFATPSIERVLGYTPEEVLNTNAFQYIHPDDLDWTKESFAKEVKENPEIKFIVVRVRKKNGEWLWCMARGHNLLSNPYINAIAVFLHDDTPRKKATAALQESEKRFRTLIRDLQVGVLLQDANGQIIMTNQAMCRIFDVSEEDLLGGKIWELYTDVIHENGRKFLQSERPSFKAIQTRQLMKDVVMGVWHKRKKERIWIMISADPILDEANEVIHVVCSFTDITQIKRLEKKSLAEKMAHQRQLSQAAIDGQEKERQEIGKELHDNIGQQLTTVKLLLDLAKTSEDNEVARMITMALKGVGDIINEIRSISRSLVPSTLQDLGLIDSVNDLIDSLRQTQALRIDLDYSGFDENALPENKKLSLFRIIQEQLNNIMKHANAQHVLISLRTTNSQILLKIADDGTGFDLQKIRKGLGLSNIRNRAELFGGSVDIQSFPGKGCEITVHIPHSVCNEVVD